MNKDYIRGFETVVNRFENTINESIINGIGTKESLEGALDAVITTLYVARLSLSTMKDNSTMEKVNECDEDCEQCDMFSELDDWLTKTFKQKGDE
jgi:hypothetical protein